MRALVISFAVHAVLVLLLRAPASPHGTVTPSAMAATADDEPMIVEVLPGDGGGGGGGRAVTTSGCGTYAIEVDRLAARQSGRTFDPDAWERRTSPTRATSQPSASERSAADVGDAGSNGDGNGSGSGSGDGNGSGTGNGIGFGNGGGVRLPDDVPRAPEPPALAPARVSKARPAKLIYPSRDREVEDDADLFVAKVTVDSDGDVIGARMTKTRPGRRGDQASSAIWTFRYLPALDDDGRPIASTLEQPFQIR